MASLGEIQRLLRQQRAVGKPSSTAESRALYEAYFDAQASKNLQIGALELEREKVATQESQFEQSLALQKEQQESQEKTQMIQGITQLGTLAYQGSQTKLGGKAISSISSLFGGGTSTAPAVTMGVSGASIPAADAAALSAVPTTTEALAPAVTSLGAGATGAGTGTVSMGVSGAAIPAADAAALSATPTTGSAVSAGGGSSVGVASGIAAAVAFDDILSREIAGTSDDPVASWAQKTRGLFRYGGSSPLTTALAEKALGDKGTALYNKLSDPSEFLLGEDRGIITTAENIIGSVISVSLPKALGGGGTTGSKTIDTILNPVGKALGTWLCTKTKETVGMDDDEWETIGKFREYVYKNHLDWISFYVKIGPELVETINGDKSFYSDLKNTFLKPVIGLTKGGFMEAAYLSYKSATIQLINKYKPELMEIAPGGENG